MNSRGGGLNDLFEDMDRMMQEMDSVLRHFAFGGFSVADSENFFSDQLPALPPGRQQDDESFTLRDQYLKKNDRAFENARDQIRPAFPPSIFGGLFNQEQQPKLPFSNETVDKFDEEVDKQTLLKDDYKKQTMPSFQSHSKSVSVRRVQRPDGSIEETTSTRDSSGKEETRVTRIIGDKSHSFIQRKDNSDGSNETEEIFQNFDEKSIEEFNKNWNNMQQASRFRSMFDYGHPVLKNPPLPAEPEDSTATSQSKLQSALSKLYSWFK